MNPTRRHFTRLFLATAVVASVLTAGGDAYGQFYRGFRGRGAIVVAPPLFPMPYLDDPYLGGGYFPPVFAGPPSGVRVRTPYFSLNIGPRDYAPPRLNSYRYEAYRPRYDYDYRPLPLTPPPASEPSGRHRYLPGASGGIPDVTDPAPALPAPVRPNGFSRGQLRRSAAMLDAALEVRGEEGEVWAEYLQPGLIVAATEGRYLDLDISGLARRYEGVTMNRDLDHIRTLPGFSTTRDMLAAWARQTETGSAANGEPNAAEDLSPATFPPDGDPRRLSDQSVTETSSGESVLDGAVEEETEIETLPAPLPRVEAP